MTEKQESDWFYVVKCLSLLLIIVAHMPFGNVFPAETLRISVSQVGVFCFFVSAGFFYKRKPRDSIIFWKKKLHTVIVPWIVLASCTFVISILLSNSSPEILTAYVKWIFGIGSVYWYMLILTFCFFVFKYIYNDESSQYALWGCIAVSLVSILLSSLSVIKYSSCFNQYTNVFNWIGIFALGILIKKKTLHCFFTSIPVVLVSLVLFVVFLYRSSADRTFVNAYVDMFSLPIEISGCVVLFFLANWLKKFRLLIDIGKKSFFVYLIHIQIAGAINTRLPRNTVFFLLRPVVVLLVCYIIAKLLEMVLKRYNCFDKYGFVFGLR